MRRSVPGLAVRRRGDRATAEDRLVLHEVLLAAGEDRAIVDQELAGDVRVRDDDVELVAEEEGVEWAELLSPGVQGALRVVREIGESQERARRDGVAVLVDDVLAEEERKDNVQGGGYNQYKCQVRVEILQ